MTPRARGQAERLGSQCQSMTSYQGLPLCTEMFNSSIYQALSLCPLNQYTLRTSFTYYLTLTHPTRQHRHLNHLPLQFNHLTLNTHHLDQLQHGIFTILDQFINFIIYIFKGYYIDVSLIIIIQGGYFLKNGGVIRSILSFLLLLLFQP